MSDELTPNLANEVITMAHDRAVNQLEVNSLPIFLVWGIAWSVGYTALYLTNTGQRGFTAFMICMVVALAFTSLVIYRSTRGVGGESSRTGILIGAGWGLGFIAVGVMASLLGRSMADMMAVGVLINTMACLVVGLQYLATAIAYRDVVTGALGIWILVIAEIGAGFPQHLALVMAILGGGGFLVAAAVTKWRQASHA